MTHTSDHIRAGSAQPNGDAHARWAVVRVSAAAGGAAAAALGLGTLAAVVLVLWIVSPYPDSGLTGALHVGAGLWLLAQGADLVRTETLSGDPAPIALAPLLLSALPAWLLYRGTSSAVSAAGEDGDDGDDEDGDPHPGAVPGARMSVGGGTGAGTSAGSIGVREAALVAGWVLAGYLSVATLAVVFAATGIVHVDPLTALYVPAFAAVAAGCGAWAGCGRPALAPLLPIPYAEEAVAGLRAAGVALGVLAGGGALLGGASLAWHTGAAGGTYGRLSGPLAGRFAVLLIAVALVPNLAVWAFCYALGPGFSVGVGSAVGPAGASGYGLLPQFPLLAALPAPSHGSGSGGGLGWATLALSGAAALALAWYAGNADLPGWRATFRATCAAAFALGFAVTVLAAWSGGSLGNARLSEFGPNCWLSGVAATGWVLVLAVPAALTIRWYVSHPLHLNPWRTLASNSWSALRGGGRVRTAKPAPSAPAVPAQVPAPAPGGKKAERDSKKQDSNKQGSKRAGKKDSKKETKKETKKAAMSDGLAGATPYVRFDPGAPMLPFPPLTDPLPWPARPPAPSLPPSTPAPEETPRPEEAPGPEEASRPEEAPDAAASPAPPVPPSSDDGPASQAEATGPHR